MRKTIRIYTTFWMLKNNLNKIEFLSIKYFKILHINEGIIRKITKSKSGQLRLKVHDNKKKSNF